MVAPPSKTVLPLYTGRAMRTVRALVECAVVKCAVAVAIAALLPSGGLGSAGAAPTSGGETRFFNARAGVGIETPPGWILSLHTGYPNVLGILVHPGGSRISLAADGTTAKDAAALVEQNRSGFAAQGLAIDRVSPGPQGGLWVDARAPRRAQSLRQLYLVRAVDGGRDPRQSIILTLTTTPAELAPASGSLDWVVAHLVLEPPVRSDDKAQRPDGGL
jgi:hypothetical protein